MTKRQKNKLETPKLCKPGNKFVKILHLLILSNYCKLILTPQKRRNFKIESDPKLQQFLRKLQNFQFKTAA